MGVKEKKFDRNAFLSYNKAMLKRFFLTVKDSIYNPSFYVSQLEKPLGAAFRYYFAFLFLLIIAQVVLTLPAFFQAQTDIKKTVTQLVNSYPKELDVTIKDGQVSTTAQEPYIIPLPPSESSTDQPKNAAVIDTKTAYSSQQFLAYDTLSWITKDTIYYQESEGQIKSADLHKISDLHVNHEIVMNVWKSVLPYTVWIAPVIALCAFVLFALGGIWRLAYLVILALIVILIGKIAGKQFQFKQAYGLLLYAVSLPLIITSAISVAAALTTFHGIAFSFTILTLLSVIVNLFVPFKSGTAKS